ncbi:MAG: hypothetical protein AAB336_03805, partial [Acidobacteriota bacterium]
MTSLISWVGTDERGNASLYLASDSRISNNQEKWDFGRKLFTSQKYPEIFGYCGDVLFPTQILGQIIQLIDNDILFEPKDSHLLKTEKIFERLNSGLETYPYQLGFEILYGTRQFSEMKSEFYLSKIA